jgi:hypothetical protein
MSNIFLGVSTHMDVWQNLKAWVLGRHCDAGIGQRLIYVSPRRLDGMLLVPPVSVRLMPVTHPMRHARAHYFYPI